MKINDVFYKVFCINLERRPDRRKEAEAEFAKHGIEVEFINGVDGKDLHIPMQWVSEDESYVVPGDLGCVMSHMNVVLMAKQLGLKNVFVFEDDADLHPNFNELFADYIQRLPDDWAMLYLGGNHMEVPKMVADNVARISKTFTTHAYGYTEKVYDEMIAGWSAVNEKIDISLSKLHKKYPCYIFRPHIVGQRESYSDILNKVNGDWTLEKRN